MKNVKLLACRFLCRNFAKFFISHSLIYTVTWFFAQNPFLSYITSICHKISVNFSVHTWKYNKKTIKLKALPLLQEFSRYEVLIKLYLFLTLLFIFVEKTNLKICVIMLTNYKNRLKQNRKFFNIAGYLAQGLMAALIGKNLSRLLLFISQLCRL